MWCDWCVDWRKVDLLSCWFFHWQDIRLPKASYFGRRCRCGRGKRATLSEWKNKWHIMHTRPVQGETFFSKSFQNMIRSRTMDDMLKLMFKKDLKLKNILQFLSLFCSRLASQTYKGTIIPAVDRICVAISPGEVCVVKSNPMQFTPKMKHSGHCHVFFFFYLILGSVLVYWGWMEQGRPQRLRCWLETLTSPQERPQSLVTGW